MIRVKAGRAVNDPEKLITPGIIYVSKSGDGIVAHLVAVGWWDWHISLLWARPAQGVEARTGETRTRLDATRESPVAKPCAKPL